MKANILTPGRSSYQYRPADARTDVRSVASYRGGVEDPSEPDTLPIQSQACQPAELQLSPSGYEGEMVASSGQWSAIEEALPSRCSSGAINFSTMDGLHYLEDQAEPPKLQIEMLNSHSLGASMRRQHASNPTVSPSITSERSQGLYSRGWNNSVGVDNSQDSSTQLSRQSTGGFHCQQCGKAKRRACDLRYACGCTGVHLWYD